MKPGAILGLPTDERRTLRPVAPPPIVDFVGDSITALGVTATTGVLRRRTGAVAFTGKSWYAWASMQSKGRFLVGGVYGLSGATSTNVVSQYLSDLVDDPAGRHPVHPVRSGYACVLIGTNDASASVLPQYKQNMRIIVDRLLAAGIEPILCTIPPRTSFQYEKANQFIRLFAQQNGLKCVEFAQDPRITDPSTGAWISGYTDDNIHPNDIGAKAMGSVLHDAFESFGILTNRPTLVMRNGDSDVLTWPNNALLMTDGGSGVPTGWTLTGAGASSALAAISSSVGLGNEMTVTRASASTTIRSNGRTVLPGSLVTVAVRAQTTVAGSSPSVTIRPLEQNTTSLFEFTTTQDIPAGYVLAGLVEVAGGAAGGAPMQVYSSALITAGDGTVVKLSQPTIYDLNAPAGQSALPI